MKVRLSGELEIDSELARSVRPGEVPEGDFIGEVWVGEQLYRYYRDTEGKLQYKSYPEYAPRKTLRGRYRRR